MRTTHKQAGKKGDTILTSLYSWERRYDYQSLSVFFSQIFNTMSGSDADGVMEGYDHYLKENHDHIHWNQLQKISGELHLLKDKLEESLFEGKTILELEALKEWLFSHVVSNGVKTIRGSIDYIKDKIEEVVSGLVMRIYQFIYLLLNQLTKVDVNTKYRAKALWSMDVAVADVVAEKVWAAVPKMFGLAAFSQARPTVMQLSEKRWIDISLEDDSAKTVSSAQLSASAQNMKRSRSFLRLFQAYRFDTRPQVTRSAALFAPVASPSEETPSHLAQALHAASHVSLAGAAVSAVSAAIAPGMPTRTGFIVLAGAMAVFGVSFHIAATVIERRSRKRSKADKVSSNAGQSGPLFDEVPAVSHGKEAHEELLGKCMAAAA